MSNRSNATIATMGIDIGKNSFHVVGLDQRGAASQPTVGVSGSGTIPDSPTGGATVCQGCSFHDLIDRFIECGETTCVMSWSLV
jgi:hypothetical protein